MEARTAPEEAEQRSEERVPVSLEVDLEGTKGLARDVSPSGIYFETEGPFRPGSRIRFTVTFETATGGMVLDCSGEVVRVVETSAKTGVGARILQSSLRPREGAANA